MKAFKTYYTVIYAKDTNAERATLWPTLISLGNAIQEPLILSGDFNSVLSTENKLGSQVAPGETQEFRDFVKTMHLTPIRFKGFYFLFYNKQEQAHRVYSRIDWNSGNYQWLQMCGTLEVKYLAPGISN